MGFKFHWPIRFIPYEKGFFIKLRESAENLLKGAEALLALVENYSDVEKKVAMIKGIEKAGDQITHDIYTLVHKTFIHPIAPEDIHKLASELDDVLDGIEGISSRLLKWKIRQPTPECVQAAKLIHEACQKILIIFTALEKPEDKLDIGECHIVINTIENKVDQLTQDAIGILLNEEKNWRRAFKWIKILRRIEDTADHCEKISNIAREVEVKNA